MEIYEKNIILYLNLLICNVYHTLISAIVYENYSNDILELF